MAPSSLADELPDDLFSCGLCADLVYCPTTLPCCGSSFCRQCLQKWLAAKANDGVEPRCPAAGCGHNMPFRLPAPSRMLERAIEAIDPDAFAEKRRDAEEPDGTEIPGGFSAGQEVAAERDLVIGSKIVVANHTSGVVVCACRCAAGRVTVKFDQRVDSLSACLDVTPAEICPQLPSKFGVRMGERIVATRDLIFGQAVGVRFGVCGFVVGRYNEDRITVKFDERVDGSQLLVNVLPPEIQPWKLLLGVFHLAQEVAAASDLKGGDSVMVRKGTRGTIMSQYSDTRVTVNFAKREDGLIHWVNVTAPEIVPYRAPDSSLPEVRGEPSEACDNNHDGGLAVGMRVKVVSLRGRPELNGRTGILTAFREDRGRWEVQLHDDSERKLLKAENLQQETTSP